LSVAQRCPPNFTGADIYALCADAWFHAAKRSVSISASMLHIFFLALIVSVDCWTYILCFQVQTLETDPSRSDEASAEEVIVDIDDFMAVKLSNHLEKAQ
jgi:peroxin-6